MKFSENFNIFFVISMISFYFNKDFHSRISFDSDTTDYEITCERLEARKVNDIIIQMKKLLIFDRQQLKKTKQITEDQVNKHRWDVIYEINDWALIIFQKRQNNEIMQRFERQTTRILSNHGQSWNLLSSSPISKHEAAAFSVQLEAIALLFRWSLIRTAFRTSQIAHYQRR